MFELIKVKFIKRLIIISFAVFSNQAFAWYSTGHEMIANIAANKISSQTTTSINSLLNQDLAFPIVLESQPAYWDLVNPTQLGHKLSYIVLASTWPDAIKLYIWQDQRLNAKYASLHYVSSNFPIGQDCSKLDSGDAVTKAMTANKFNVVNGLNSAIKSLTSSNTSNLEKQVALRYVIHLSGDIHQPFHDSNPTYQYESQTYGTIGGVNMLFTNNPLPSAFIDNGPGQFYTYPETNFHEYVNSLFGLWFNYSDPYNSAYDDQAFTRWQNESGYFLSNLQNAASLLENAYSDRDLSPKLNDPDPFNWAKDGVDLSCNILSDLQLNGISESMTNYNFYLSVRDFQNTEQDVLNQQLYLGGMRLANLLNAIFDPTQANYNYVAYVKMIASDDNVPTLFTLLSQ